MRNHASRDIYPSLERPCARGLLARGGSIERGRSRILSGNCSSAWFVSFRPNIGFERDMRVHHLEAMTGNCDPN
ncbi:hypothetical protein VNO77_33894 [Canavalia gladiata]|uniref:Uncharacterized protein n=1 Tax=Canavalia gladiata TaxID=3824 RepID=A0AAN9KFR8_CANGL